MHLNWDAPILIDGAYRVFLNQKPHVDFSTPLGPIIFIVGAIGMKATTPTIVGMHIGYILFGITILLASYAFTRHLRPYVIAFLLLLVASMVFTPRILSYQTYNFGYTGIYNAFGFALFFLLSLATFANFRPASPRSVTKGFSVGLILVVLGFLKITFGLAGVI
jgi:hypothetical protein